MIDRAAASAVVLEVFMMICGILEAILHVEDGLDIRSSKAMLLSIPSCTRKLNQDLSDKT